MNQKQSSRSGEKSAEQTRIIEKVKKFIKDKYDFYFDGCNYIIDKEVFDDIFLHTIKLCNEALKKEIEALKAQIESVKFGKGWAIHRNERAMNERIDKFVKDMRKLFQKRQSDGMVSHNETVGRMFVLNLIEKEFVLKSKNMDKSLQGGSE